MTLVFCAHAACSQGCWSFLINTIINELYWIHGFLFLLIKHVLYTFFFCFSSLIVLFSFSSSLPVFCFLPKTSKYQSLFVSVFFLSSAGVVPSLLFVPAAG